MLVNLPFSVCGLCAMIPLMFIVFLSFYAYRINERRAIDDPEKRDFSRIAVWMVPITLPLLLVVYILRLVVSSLFFALVLLLFPFALLFIRKPVLFKLIRKLAAKIGNPLLEINTELLRFMGFYRNVPAPAIELQFEG